jgi:holo-[acyl-carrier protein] synthase
MMVIAIGTDIVDIARIQAAVENPKTGERFRDRIFTPDEIAYCARKRRAHESYAARFAAKEAVVKVLGEPCGWRDVEVVRDDGRPSLRLSGRAAEVAARLGIARWHLSLSHSETLAIAYVVAESE